MPADQEFGIIIATRDAIYAMNVYVMVEGKTGRAHPPPDFTQSRTILSPKHFWVVGPASASRLRPRPPCRYAGRPRRD